MLGTDGKISTKRSTDSKTFETNFMIYEALYCLSAIESFILWELKILMYSKLLRAPKSMCLIHPLSGGNVTKNILTGVTK